MRGQKVKALARIVNLLSFKKRRIILKTFIESQLLTFYPFSGVFSLNGPCKFKKRRIILKTFRLKFRFSH